MIQWSIGEVSGIHWICDNIEVGPSPTRTLQTGEVSMEGDSKVSQNKSQKTGLPDEAQARDGLPTEEPQTRWLCAEEIADDKCVSVKDAYFKTHRCFIWLLLWKMQWEGRGRCNRWDKKQGAARMSSEPK